jgi:hypothetical protein
MDALGTASGIFAWHGGTRASPVAQHAHVVGTATLDLHRTFTINLHDTLVRPVALAHIFASCSAHSPSAEPGSGLASHACISSWSSSYTSAQQPV